MKTQEELVRRHAVGPISIYQIYQEGYQDRELDDWPAFRREAAKDILAGMLLNPGSINVENKRLQTIEGFVNGAVMIADELIKQLQEK